MNGHTPLVKKDSNSTAIVEVNSLSEDDQHVNLADHDGMTFDPSNFLFKFIYFRRNI